jgi:CBS domain-containing protein
MQRRHPVVARPDETAQAAAARMAAHACGSILVRHGDGRYGIVTERDLATRVVGQGLDPTRTLLAAVMTCDPDRIESTRTAGEALRRMGGLAHRHLLVMEDGGVLGVISLRDLPLEALAGMLPELEQWHAELEQWHALAERMR